MTLRERRAVFSMARVAVILLATSGCPTGYAANKHPVAIGPAGVHTDIRLPESRVRGELLEVRDSGMVILSTSELVIVPFTSIRLATFRELELVMMGQPVAPEKQREARLLSRFPGGMPEPVLRQLMAARGQSELLVRRR